MQPAETEWSAAEAEAVSGCVSWHAVGGLPSESKVTCGTATLLDFSLNTQ